VDALLLFFNPKVPRAFFFPDASPPAVPLPALSGVLRSALGLLIETDYSLILFHWALLVVLSVIPPPPGHPSRWMSRPPPRKICALVFFFRQGPCLIALSAFLFR